MIDAMIPLGPNDGDTVELTARSVKHFVEGVRNVYVVSREDPRLPGVTFVPEESFPFDLETVRRALGEHDRAGWYLQQLIKLYFPLAVSGSLDQVLVVDADTIFLRTCRFVEDGRTVLNFGDEYHAPYFAHMARLHPALRKMFAYSGVSHCMLLTRSWLLELLGAVEERHAQAPFWKVYLEAVDLGERKHSGASEYEIYFNFCLLFHPLEVILRRFHWRNAAGIEEIQPDQDEYVSLHSYLRKEPLDRRKLAAIVFPAAEGKEVG